MCYLYAWLCECISGAELLLYPSSFGISSASQSLMVTSSKDVEVEVTDIAKAVAAISHWHRTITGHAAANLVPVVVSNRIGLEVRRQRDNREEEEGIVSMSGAASQPLLTFQGSSFITSCTGEIRRSHLATRSREAVLVAEVRRQARPDFATEHCIYIASHLSLVASAAT